MKKYTLGPETKRIIHRAHKVEDADAFFRLNGSQQVMRYTGEPPLRSVGAARTAIEEYPDFDTVGYGRWACVLKETHQVVGFCGLKYLPDLDIVDVGYRFLPEFWGLGLATEACSACLSFGFQTLKLKRIEAFVLPENAASIRVLEKVGMRCMGPILFDGLQALRYSIERPAI